MSAPRVAGLTELLAEHGDATYREVLRVPALSLGLFAAAPGHDDVQSPHDVDEIYAVVAGRAVLEVDSLRTQVEAGSVAYIPSARPAPVRRRHRRPACGCNLCAARTRLTWGPRSVRCAAYSPRPRSGLSTGTSSLEAARAADTLRGEVVARDRMLVIAGPSTATSAHAADWLPAER